VGRSRAGCKASSAGQAKLFSLYLKVQWRFPSSHSVFEVNVAFALKITILATSLKFSETFFTV